MLDSKGLELTALYESHVALKANMGPFGGWNMPIQYAGILAEHQHTREKVSIFDVSHMGEFLIEGDYAASGLDNLLTMPLADMPLKTCRYGAMLNNRGGVIDDLIVFRLEANKWFLVVNAATAFKDKEHLERHLKPTALFRDLSSGLGKVDVQGPLAREVLKSFVKDIEKLDFYTFDHFDVLGENVIVSRTGYTGELGYEIYYPWKKTVNLWEHLLTQEDVQPAGLGARDVLRLEVGYGLYGHELRENLSALASGLGRFTDWEKEFIGKDALFKERQAGPACKVLGIVSSNRRSPRVGHTVFSGSGEVIGEVTSGTFSPCLEKGIGMAVIASDHANRGDTVSVGDLKNSFPAQITSRIFYKQGSLKS